MKSLVIGCDGQVGREVTRLLAVRNEVLPLGRSGLDMESPDAIRAVLRAYRPKVIVNAAAYTGVDRAESESELAHAVNARAPGVLAEEALAMDALLVHYSTDYVFDGSKDTPYVESDTPNPLGVYGRSKLLGEQAIQSIRCRHVILRTSWVYSSHGSNFLLTIRRLAAERPEIRVVDDQFGAPTSAFALARATQDILESQDVDTRHSGIYHLACGGRTSWFEFANWIVGNMGRTTAKVLPIPSSEYPTAARRPRNSSLNCSKIFSAFGIDMPHWKVESMRVLQDLNHLAAGSP